MAIHCFHYFYLHGTSMYTFHGYKPVSLTSYKSVMLYVWTYNYMEQDDNL